MRNNKKNPDRRCHRAWNGLQKKRGRVFCDDIAGNRRFRIWNFRNRSELFTDSDTSSKTKSGEDVSEVFGLREYRPGDRWQKVHWKMTARQEHIWVKEYSLPIGASVVLAAENGRKEKIPGNFIRAFASLRLDFLHMNVHAMLHGVWRKQVR